MRCGIFQSLESVKFQLFLIIKPRQTFISSRNFFQILSANYPIFGTSDLAMSSPWVERFRSNFAILIQGHFNKGGDLNVFFCSKKCKITAGSQNQNIKHRQNFVSVNINNLHQLHLNFTNSRPSVGAFQFKSERKKNTCYTVITKILLIVEDIRLIS